MTASDTTSVRIATGGDGHVPLSERFKRLATQFRLGPALVVLMIIWVFFTIQNPLFLSPGNLTNLAMQSAVMAIIAVGLVFILLLGEIDLSVAALSGVGGAVAASLAVLAGWSAWAAILVAIIACVLWAVVQGLLVLFGAPSFIVTMAGSLALGGVLLMLLPESGQINLGGSNLQFIAGYYLPSWLGFVVGGVGAAVVAAFLWTQYRARVKFGLPASAVKQFVLPGVTVSVALLALVVVFNSHRGIPLVIALLVAVIAIIGYTLRHTRFGINVYAVGGNSEAARRAGIPVGRTILICFALAGLFAALGGIVAASRLLGVSNQSGAGALLLQAIAAAVIGGTSLFGGRGSIWSALLGALLIGSINNGMDLLGLTQETKLIVTGLVLVIATLVDVILSRGTISWRKN